VVKHGAQRRANHWINIPYICSPEGATETGRPLLSFAFQGWDQLFGAFPVVPHYAVLRASPLATICRAAGAGLVDSAKASEACRMSDMLQLVVSSGEASLGELATS